MTRPDSYPIRGASTALPTALGTPSTTPKGAKVVGPADPAEGDDSPAGGRGAGFKTVTFDEGRDTPGHDARHLGRQVAWVRIAPDDATADELARFFDALEEM